MAQSVSGGYELSRATSLWAVQCTILIRRYSIMPGGTITKEECQARRRQLIDRIKDDLAEDRSWLDELLGWGPTVDDVVKGICCAGEENGCDCEEILQYYKDQTDVITSQTYLKFRKGGLAALVGRSAFAGAVVRASPILSVRRRSLVIRASAPVPSCTKGNATYGFFPFGIPFFPFSGSLDSPALLTPPAV
jgi:hypothetical protein